MLHYGFSSLGLHNIMLDVAGHNEAGIHAYQRAEFQEIGRRREAYQMGGEWHDKIYMDVLPTDFDVPVFGKIHLVSLTIIMLAGTLEGICDQIGTLFWYPFCSGHSGHGFPPTLSDSI